MCQLLLPCFMLLDHSRGSEDFRVCRAIINYASKHITIFCENDLKKLRKIALRCSRANFKISELLADNQNLLSGKKVVLTAFFLTQLIFDSRENNINEKELELASRTKRLIEFATEFLQKNVSEEDIDTIAKSAEKQAKKIFEGIYKNI